MQDAREDDQGNAVSVRKLEAVGAALVSAWIGHAKSFTLVSVREPFLC